MKIFLTVFLMSLVLSACSTNPTVLKKTNLQPISIPSEILDCDRIVVTPPDSKNLKNRDVVAYIQKLRRSLNECQGDTSTVKELIDKYNKEVERFNQENIKNE